MSYLPVTLFQVLNYLEAVLWGGIGVGFLVYGFARADAGRGRSLAAGVTFVLFGLSDVVEAQTGAWWRPWWLLLWKGACVAVLAGLALEYVLRRRAR